MAYKRAMSRRKKNLIFVILLVLAVCLLFTAVTLAVLLPDRSGDTGDTGGTGGDPTGATGYTVSYPAVTKVGYSAEYLGTVERNIPAQTQDGGLEQYPRYGYTLGGLTTEQKNELIAENGTLCAVGTAGAAATDTYDCMDAEGNLYLNGEKKDRLYKHTASAGLYLGDVSDDEPAVIKRITVKSRGAGYNITGLYAPAGEVVRIETSAADLLAAGGFYVYIGQALYNGQANNIWAARDMNRMPVLLNRMTLTENTYTRETDGDGNSTFYVGSFLGGPIYIQPVNASAQFTVTVSGAVNYSHFILGYTTQEEFEQNAKSSAPYFDLMVWDSGVLHSGPKMYAEEFDYGELYDAAVLWDKISIVSTSVKSTACGIVFLYDPFVAAGAAVAFPGRNSVNCPLGWMSSSLNYQAFVTSGSWGNIHEYNHNFQGWGLPDGGEVTNNALSLVSYSLFTDISSARAVGTADEGLSGWNRYTSASWAAGQVCSSRENDLSVYATLLHAFGQENFLATAKTSGTDNYFTLWSDTVGYDMSYFAELVGIPMSETAAAAVREKNYPVFVPVASAYQTGRSYVTDGQKKYSETVRPYAVEYGKPFTFDLNRYDFSSGTYGGGSIYLPEGFTYTVKSVSAPEYGTVSELGGGLYRYTPDAAHTGSGKIYVTLGITREDGSFRVEDVELVLEFEQSLELNKTVLEREIYTSSEEEHLYATAKEAYESGFEGYSLTYQGNNVNSTQHSNAEIWGPHTEFNTFMVLSGKLYIAEDGDYRIALRGRRSTALYLSYDGEEYFYATEENADMSDDVANDTYSYDLFGLKAGSWIYFRGVLKVTEARSYIAIGWGKWEDPLGVIDGETGEFVPDDPAHTEPTVTLTYPSAYRNSYEFTERKFTSEYFRTRRYAATYRVDDSSPNAAVVEASDCWEGYPVEYILDGDDTNFCHSLYTVSEEKPWGFTIDLGQEIRANTFECMGRYLNDYQTPNSFRLYLGVSPDEMSLAAEIAEGTVSGGLIAVNFEETAFRYYRLEITNSVTGGNKYVAIRYIRFSYSLSGGEQLSPDSAVISYRGDWRTEAAFSSFGHLLVGGDGASATFVFTGERFAVLSCFAERFGGFEVWIDGAKAAEVSLGSENSAVDYAYLSEALSRGEHVVEIKGTGVFNVDSVVLWS